MRPQNAVVGCSTGEDAYACALLLATTAALPDRIGTSRIFATDTDTQQLALARRGVYQAAQLGQLTPAQRQQAFVATAMGYRISSAIREGVIFAAHDLLHAPPFAHLDLIVCRKT
ncbi:MAG: hypothetical protein HGA45_02895 [Chloroflexales bacterium]|nr:hypothetical protein [Chloroflexales bacterium]